MKRLEILTEFRHMLLYNHKSSQLSRPTLLNKTAIHEFVAAVYALDPALRSLRPTWHLLHDPLLTLLFLRGKLQPTWDLNHLSRSMVLYVGLLVSADDAGSAVYQSPSYATEI